jgi:hypothetical protein
VVGADGGDTAEGRTAYGLYVFGDWTAENTALTESSGKGRIIKMVDSGNVNNNAIQMQHESYRDGIKSSNQVGETVEAVKAHTAMAVYCFC